MKEGTHFRRMLNTLYDVLCQLADSLDTLLLSSRQMKCSFQIIEKGVVLSSIGQFYDVI